MRRRPVGIPFSPLPFRFHDVRYSDQMEKIGEHVVGVRRVVVVPVAVAIDIAEVRGVARIHGASPVIVARRR